MSDDKLLSRRQILGLFGASTGALIVGTGQADPQNVQGQLKGGTSDMAGEFKVGPGLWKGPLSVRSEVPEDDGNDFIQTDAGENGDQYAMHHYNGGWDLQGLNTSSLETENLNNTEWVVNAGEPELYDALSNLGANRTLYVVGGSYDITQTHPIPDGLNWFNLNNPTFQRADSSLEFMFRGEGSAESYDGPSDVTIEGGTFDLNNSLGTNVTGIYFANGTDLTLRGVTMKNCYHWHHLEFNHCKHALVEKCRFEGMDGSRVSEYVQLDHQGSTAGVPVKDITFRSCTFEETLPSKNVGNNVAIGNHNPATDVIYRDINVDDCHFTDIDHHCVRFLNAEDVTVDDPTAETSSTSGRSSLARVEARQSTDLDHALTVTNPEYDGNTNNSTAPVIAVIPDGENESIAGATVEGGNLDTHGTHAMFLSADDVRVEGGRTKNIGGQALVARSGASVQNRVNVDNLISPNNTVEIGHWDDTAPATQSVNVSGCHVNELHLRTVDTVIYHDNQIGGGGVTEESQAANVNGHHNWVNGSWVA